MAALTHGAITPITTPVTTVSTTFADVSGGSIADSAFTAGKQYLIKVSAVVNNDSSGGTIGVQTVHGSTAFPDSVMEMNAGTSGNWFTYLYWEIWTAVSSEGIKIQTRSGNALHTTSIDRVEISYEKLSDDLTENTDWFLGIRENDDALSTTPADGGSITFTPATASHDWLVMTLAQIDPVDSTTQHISALIRSGEASSSTPTTRMESHNAGDTNLHVLSEVFTLGAASNTFKEQASSSSTTHTRLRSKVFALNLNKFAAHAFAYTDADLNGTTSSFADALQTLNITPTVTGDVALGGTFGFDANQVARACVYRLQLDNADQPAGQTADAYSMANRDNTDERPHGIFSLALSLSNAAHTVDLDGNVSSITNTPAYQHRSLWAYSMELAASGPVIPVFMNQYRQRRA